MTLSGIRERLTLALVALLPLHALFVTVSTKLIAGPGHAPLTGIALWKEVLLVLILMIAVVELLTQRTVDSGQWTGFRRLFSTVHCKLSTDPLDWLILSLIAWSLIVSFALNTPLASVALGFRYDFVPLVAFLVLRRVRWSDGFASRLMRVILGAGIVVAVYGLLTLLLPAGFFSAIGYSALHSLYLPESPIAAFQHIEHSSFRRIQSTMSGPNQLGLWLLLPVAVLWARAWSARMFAVGVVIVAALISTFSRSAWLAAAAMACVAGLAQFGGRVRKRDVLAGSAAVAVLALMLLLLSPSVILRFSSTRGHFERPLEALQTMAANPLGLGLGTAGPASNRVSEACVMLRPNDDPSWAKDRPDLCVFVGDSQVQPADRACLCPRLTENWYLQLGVEAGVIGFTLFLLLIAFTMLRLWERRADPSAFVVFLAFTGLGIASLFLHAWEDTALAWTLWIWAALVLSQPPQILPHPRRGAAGF
jgi:hypothetical protein